MVIGSQGIGGINRMGGFGGQGFSLGGQDFSRSVEGPGPGAMLLRYERHGIFGGRPFRSIDISSDRMGGSRSTIQKLGILGRFERAQTLTCGPYGCP